MRAGAPAPDGAGHLDAGRLGQLQVEHDMRRLPLGREVDGIFAVAGFDHLDVAWPQLLDGAPREAAVQAVIFRNHHQHQTASATG